MLLIDDASCTVFGGELQLGSLSLRYLLPQMVGGWRAGCRPKCRLAPRVPQSFVSVTLSFNVCLDTHEIPHSYSYFFLSTIYNYLNIMFVSCWNLYILNRFNKLRKWLIPFHAIWSLCWYIFFVVIFHCWGAINLILRCKILIKRRTMSCRDLTQFENPQDVFSLETRIPIYFRHLQLFLLTWL